METEIIYIQFLNAEKNFKIDSKEFESIEDAFKWGISNIENFNLDMIKYK